MELQRNTEVGPPQGAAGDWYLWASVGVLSILAGGLHVAAAWTHREVATLSALFLIAAIIQIGWGITLMLRPPRVLVIAGGVLNAAFVVFYVVTRITGVGIEGLEDVQPFGFQDVVTTLLEIGAAVGALALLRPSMFGSAAKLKLGPQGLAVVSCAALLLAGPAFAASTSHSHGHDHVDTAAHDHGEGDDHEHTEGMDHEHGDGDADHGHGDGDGDADHGHGDGDADHGSGEGDDHGHGDGDSAHADGDAHAHGDDAGHLHDAADPGHAHDPGDPGHPHEPGTPHEPGEPGHPHEPGEPGEPGHPHEPGDPNGEYPDDWTDAEVAYADALRAATANAMVQYDTPAKATASGFVWIGDGGAVGGYQHWINLGRFGDGRILDPVYVESLVFKNTGAGLVLEAAMFILPFGYSMSTIPTNISWLPGWHLHDNLCFNGIQVVGVLSNGTCPPGSVLVITPPMLHIWLVDTGCGPFAGVDENGLICDPNHQH